MEKWSNVSSEEVRELLKLAKEGQPEAKKELAEIVAGKVLSGKEGEVLEAVLIIFSLLD
jgi:predicted transcriptional regulator